VAFILMALIRRLFPPPYPAQLTGQAHATEVMAERMASRGQPMQTSLPVQVNTQVWYNPDLVSSYFMIPGVIGMILFALTSILTATAIVRERERGTIEQLIVTPIRPWELVIGKLVPYVLLALLNALEVLALGAWWFKVPIRGDLGLIFAFSGLFLLTSLGIGLLASTIANTQQERMLSVWMLLLPAIFLSGFFFPIECHAKSVAVISYVMPCAITWSSSALLLKVWALRHCGKKYSPWLSLESRS
jgi:ABC-2 type transport system permease protein